MTAPITSADEAASDPVSKAIELVLDAAATDGDHHKDWFFDQILKTLAADRYDELVTQWQHQVGHLWETGTAP